MREKRLEVEQGVIDKLIKVWAALGDKVSKIYCGTSSVATHMTKKENNSLLSTLGGAFTSFNRYLNASHSDLFKQKCIDSLLGTSSPMQAPEITRLNTSPRTSSASSSSAPSAVSPR